MSKLPEVVSRYLFFPSSTLLPDRSRPLSVRAGSSDSDDLAEDAEPVVGHLRDRMMVQIIGLEFNLLAADEKPLQRGLV